MRKASDKIYVVNYATDDFLDIQAINAKTAMIFGKATAVFSYSFNDINSIFINNNISVFSEKRGAGLWLWKPYILNDALAKIDYGDYLFYSDSGVVFISNLNKVVSFQKEVGQDIIPFVLPLIEEQWTKGECFEELGCSDNFYRKTNQIMATYFLIKKTKLTVGFVNEYLSYSQNMKAIHYKIFDVECKNSDNFIAHREDQSIFSLLCKKYRFKAFKEPSQFGIMPWGYKYDNVIYNPLDHKKECPFILISVRSIKSYKKYCLKIILKCFLSRYLWFRTKEIKKRSGIIFMKKV